MIRTRIVTRAWPELAAMKDGFLNLLKTQYYIISVANDAQITFYENRPIEDNDNALVKIFITGENTRPANPEAFDLILGFKQEKKNEYYLPLWTFYMNWNADDVTDSHCITHFLSKRFPSQKIPQYFCGFVSCRYRPYRVSFVQKLSNNYKQVTCGGVILNNIGGDIGLHRDQKQEFLRKCKFGIAFENESVDCNMIGYTTEKIFEVFAAGIVPIYWGDPTIDKIFNPKAFLNRHNFATDEAFIEEIAAIDQNDTRYFAMLEEPIFLNNQIPQSFYPDSVCRKIAELYFTKTI